MISTTSDWTTVRLVGGAEWHSPTVIAASDTAIAAGPEGDYLALKQPIEDAESNRLVQMEVAVSLSGLDPEELVVFEIDRGHIGATRVTIAAESGTEVATVTWDGVASGASNTHLFEVSPQPFLGSNPNEYTVIAQLNFWFYGPGEFGGFENADGSRMTPLTPLLGETYAAADPAVVHQQIEWAVEYGVDAFSIQWTTPRGVGCCGSMEDTLDDVFLKSPNIHKVRFVIFYDLILRMDQTKELGVDVSRPLDFDRPEVYDTFVDDFVHFADKYFGHPQYLAIDGRPVIYVWASFSFEGDLAGAIAEARARVAEAGFDVFIVGDEVRTDRFDRDHVALFDGSSTFTFLIPGIDWRDLEDVGQATAAVDAAFTRWRGLLDGVNVAGRDEPVNFQPAWTPQYDDRFIVFQNPRYVPARSREQVVEMATMVRSHSEPVGSSGQRLIWLNTWNNWAETTTVEPTAARGPKYPAGNYQFDMLEVNREVFGAETFADPPMP